MKISISDLEAFKSASSHSHIKELTTSSENGNGLIGQMKARRALNILKSSIMKNPASGRIIILKGEKGTGKTALAMALSKSLGNVPINMINASELFCLDISITESLVQAIRKSVTLEIRRTCRVVMGEVVAKRESSITLKTEIMESKYEMGEQLMLAIEKMNIAENDVIRINLETGKISKLGRTKPHDGNFLNPGDRIVSCPENEIEQIVSDAEEVTLHELDVINSRTDGKRNLFSGNSGEIPSEIRNEVNSKVSEWISEESASLKAGILFIDESKILNSECYSFLNKILEEKWNPILILATNCMNTNNYKISGIPADFLDRALTITTQSYTKEECAAILQLRAQEENISVPHVVLEKLAVMALESGLRYALNILSMSSIVNKGTEISLKSIEKIYDIFIDLKRTKTF